MQHPVACLPVLSCLPACLTAAGAHADAAAYALDVPQLSQIFAACLAAAGLGALRLLHHFANSSKAMKPSLLLSIT